MAPLTTTNSSIASAPSVSASVSASASAASSVRSPNGSADNASIKSNKSNNLNSFFSSQRKQPKEFQSQPNRQPLPRVSDAVPVAQEANRGTPKLGVIDSEPRQRLLHSRFSSLSRIRSRRRSSEDSSHTNNRAATSTASTNTTTNNTTSSIAPTDSLPSSPLSNAISVADTSPAQTPLLGFNDTITQDAFGRLSLEHVDSAAIASPSPSATLTDELNNSSLPSKAASVYSTDSIDSRAKTSLSSHRPQTRQEEGGLSKQIGSSPVPGPVVSSSDSASVTSQGARNMHQTSSRLLRMTDDDRPFTRVSYTYDIAVAATAAICSCHRILS